MINMDFAGLQSPFNGREGAKFCVIPVPYDMTTTYGGGTSLGPQAIIEASAHMELYEEDLGKNIAEDGIWTMPPVVSSDSKSMVCDVEKAVSDAFEGGMFPLVLGGEHMVSYGAVKAALRHYPGLAVVQFDAHADLRDVYNGDPLSHACTMARISELCPTLQLGIRSFSDDEADEVKKRMDSKKLFTAEQLLDVNVAQGAAGSVAGDVYITFDVDFFDPSVMPATGTPEPGGLSWYDALRMLRKISANASIVGCDIMELAPIEGIVHPNFTCAKLAYKLMSLARN